MISLLTGIYLGILFFFIHKARKHIQLQTFKFKVWYKENKMRLIYAAIMGTILCLILHLYPQSYEFVQFIGFNVTEEAFNNGSAVLFGAFIASSTYTRSEDNS